MTATQIAIVIVVVAAIAIAILLVAQRQRSRQLREHFGDEYERAVREYGDRSKAESELAARQKRVERLKIRPLDERERSRYAEQWKTTQARFVDDPSRTIADADRLVGEVMKAKGYPMADFDQRTADISVDHPAVVDHYRTAHEIAERHRSRPVGTEELRKAFIHYRELFRELLNGGAPPAGERAERGERSERAEERTGRDDRGSERTDRAERTQQAETQQAQRTQQRERVGRDGDRVGDERAHEDHTEVRR